MRAACAIAAFLALQAALPVRSALASPPVSPPVSRHPDWAALVHQPGNLYSVTPTFFRSARLRGADVKRLQALGIKTVVSLRAFHRDDAVLRNSGILAVSVPINTWAISDAKVILALRAIRAAERQGPVLLHCQHGADRTGLVTAMYRMLYQQRTREQVLAELKDGGYGYHTIWTNIESYLLNVDLDTIREGVERP